MWNVSCVSHENDKTEKYRKAQWGHKKHKKHKRIGRRLGDLGRIGKCYKSYKSWEVLQELPTPLFSPYKASLSTHTKLTNNQSMPGNTDISLKLFRAWWYSCKYNAIIDTARPTCHLKHQSGKNCRYTSITSPSSLLSPASSLSSSPSPPSSSSLWSRAQPKDKSSANCKYLRSWGPAAHTWLYHTSRRMMMI